MNAELATALVDLRAPDASKRLAASRVIERAARMASSSDLLESLGRRSVTAAPTVPGTQRQGTHKGCPYGSQSNAL